VPIQPTAETIKALQAIAEGLFDETDAGRVTVRVDTPNDRDYPVLAEARAPGVSSITGGMTLVGYKPIDIHAASTLKVLRDERKMIVQRDVRVDPPQIPALEDYYGMTSQMLTPLEHEGQFVGVVSVHAVEPREWTDAAIGAIEEATSRVEEHFREATWVELD
jgi:GAF domain-containing protein